MEDAVQRLERMIEQDSENARLPFRCGVLLMQIDHQRLSNFAKAQEHFEKAVSLDPEFADAHYHLGVVMQVQTRYIESIVPLEKAVALDPAKPNAQFHLAMAYLRAGRTENAQGCLERVLELDPTHTGAMQHLHDLEQAEENLLKRVSYFPNDLREVELIDAVEEHLLDPEYPVVLGEKSKVATFGSCFAGNIARALNQLGVSAKNTTFGELINSTAANARYVDWVVGEADDAVSQAIIGFHGGDPNFSSDPQVHFQQILQSDLIVLTLGVAAAFFRRDTGELAIPARGGVGLRGMMKSCEFRTIPVSENVGNLLHIVDRIRSINRTAKIVMTVSPVPLTATFEYPSAVMADCVSKSTLRVAVDEIVRQTGNSIIYWPSFEIVRWFGAYYPGAYGAEDGTTIHVSEDLIDLIVGLFIERLSGGHMRAVNRRPR